ncbi:uncharacterized protein LOC110622397 isoform X2 [Manihot esculenta]|uniref:Uncharacterized protein n=6 Tax=Manihot esculenta TaxID=3983 RepID=A0ACB7H4J1_MANES|nr:uncharacterized protein LOC110622397 isoform X2 [Manihot esculenta]KAG8647472.1 hypothetical protein MANES_09G082100v8 [Manihot esculenta]KAG8647474.1 hypothetical protein MANES_09G082100v8 [Manihot esculenta]KAG8647476.1 hypothetical protein MANES_09G082100v8 [Manihot esculenta]KAG8647478.1 hypothetical protein MANES_09G082100v8 [Manihot esculenta]KAG8647480.1 hypothetical protein MANES_09G082100v8 [Manihot esculenta]
MIMMEEGSERTLMRSLQKEQERERRRIRDRQRRQSMTIEEREKHLARRRRNYQLRRQRAETARLDLRVNQNITTSSFSTMLATKSNDYSPMTSVSIFNAQCNVGLNSGHKNSVDLIIKGNANANSSCVPSKGLRLNCVKRLARSLKSDLEKATSENHQNKMEVEQNLLNGELQLQMLSMSNDGSKLVQTSSVRCGNEWLLPL